MAKETQNLVDLVQPQRGLALLQIADKPHPHSSPIGKIMLGQPRRKKVYCAALDLVIKMVSGVEIRFLATIPAVRI